MPQIILMDFCAEKSQSTLWATFRQIYRSCYRARTKFRRILADSDFSDWAQQHGDPFHCEYLCWLLYLFFDIEVIDTLHLKIPIHNYGIAQLYRLFMAALLSPVGTLDHSLGWPIFGHSPPKTFLASSIIIKNLLSQPKP